MAERVDQAVEAHTARQAAEHQAAVLPGLSDERLQLVAERLAKDAKGNTSAQARLTVVRQEIRNRGIN